MFTIKKKRVKRKENFIQTILNMKKNIISIALCGTVFETMICFPFHWPVEMFTIYQMLWLIIYFYMQTFLLHKKCYSRLRTNGFAAIGIVCGMFVKVMQDFGQASMKQYLDMKSMVVYVLIVLLLINIELSFLRR